MATAGLDIVVSRVLYYIASNFQSLHIGFRSRPIRWTHLRYVAAWSRLYGHRERLTARPQSDQRTVVPRCMVVHVHLELAVRSTEPHTPTQFYSWRLIHLAACDAQQCTLADPRFNVEPIAHIAVRSVSILVSGHFAFVVHTVYESEDYIPTDFKTLPLYIVKSSLIFIVTGNSLGRSKYYFGLSRLVHLLDYFIVAYIMPNKCVAVGCTSGYDGKDYDSGRRPTLHRFPKDEDILRRWLRAISREDFRPSQCSRVCSNHFQPSDFVEEHNDSNSTRQHHRLETCTRARAVNPLQVRRKKILSPAGGTGARDTVGGYPWERV
jgi:hypothetical protein